MREVRAVRESLCWKSLFWPSGSLWQPQSILRDGVVMPLALWCQGVTSGWRVLLAHASAGSLADGLCLTVPSWAALAPRLSVLRSLHVGSLFQNWHLSMTYFVNHGTAVKSKFSGTILYQAFDKSKGIRSLYTNLSYKWSHFLQNIRPDPTPTPAGPEHRAGEPWAGPNFLPGQLCES